MNVYLKWTLFAFAASLTCPVQAQRRPMIPLQQRILQQVDQNDSSIRVSGASDTVVPYLLDKQEKLSLAVNREDAFYRHGLDTGAISAGLPTAVKSLNIIKSYLDTRGDRMNLRSLNSVLVLVQESMSDLKEWQSKLNGYATEMDTISKAVEGIVEDSTVKALPADTLLFKVAVQELREIDQKYTEVGQMQRSGLIRIGLLQDEVQSAFLEGTTLVDEVNYRMREVKRKIWYQEEVNLWQATPSQYKTGFWSGFIESVQRGLEVTQIFMATTWDTRVISLIALLVLIVWTWLNLRKIKRRKDALSALLPVHFLSRSIVLACLVLVVTFGAFLESNVPMSYLNLTGFLMLAGISVLLYPYLMPRGRELGLWAIILWVGYALDDVLGETTFAERWMLFAGAIATIFFCLRLLRYQGQLVKGITFPKVLQGLASLTLVMAVLSLAFDILGRTTLSKLFGLTGVHTLVYAVTLWVSSTVVLEVIYLQSEASKESRFSAFLNFSDLRRRFQYFLRILCGLYWLILLARNLSIFEPLYTGVVLEINKERTLGSINFSLGSVFIFILIIWIASVVAQFISFVFGQELQSASRKRNVGGIALMARLGVLTIGFMIAVGASGIPLEKVSLIVGALGVGIGFGLQNIVNNLVSGIILAFEKPIQVGDQVDISGQSGVVKEIGIRASKISNVDGADIVIPNGNFISQVLVNWTMSARNGRVAMAIRTTRETDLGKVTDLIKGVIKVHPDILNSPTPSVLIDNFGSNWVEFQVTFWCKDPNNQGGITHAFIAQMNQVFEKEGIQLANPAQDIYIRKE